MNKWALDLDSSDAQYLNSHKIDFVFNEGKGYLKEVNEGSKIINNRITLLLSYLSVMVSCLAQFILAAHSMSWLTVWGFLCVLEYVGLIIYIAVKLLMPRLSFSTNTEPKCLLDKSVIRFPLDSIKLSECENIQNRIEKNRRMQAEKASRFKYSLILTFSLPVTTAFVCFVASITMKYLCCLWHTWSF